MTVQLSELRRRDFGLERVVYVIRCDQCRAKSEVRERHTAEALQRRHECDPQISNTKGETA